MSNPSLPSFTPRSAPGVPLRRLAAALSRAFVILPAAGVAVLPAASIAQSASSGQDVRVEAAVASHAARKRVRASKPSPAKASAGTSGRESPRALVGDSGNPCFGAPGCLIQLSQPSAGHSATGPTGGTIAHVFTGPQTLMPTSFGLVQVGAIFLRSVGGDGGDAKSPGDSGGQGGVGGEVGNSGSPVTLQPGVTATGDHPFPLTAFVSTGGAGGGGHGSSDSNDVGTGGQGGAGGTVAVAMNGTIGGANGDGSQGGLQGLSWGGAGGSGDDGGINYYASKAGAGGAGGPVTVTIAGTVNTTGYGATILSIGGVGAVGPDDKQGISGALGSAGGTGGSAGRATLAVSGTVTSTSNDGAVVAASGGAGGSGGTGTHAPSVSSGDGGAGGQGGLAFLTISGTTQGPRAGGAATASGGHGGTGGVADGSDSSGDTGRGGFGGAGGDGGTSFVSLKQGASVVGGQTGIVATAAGGNGGAGGSGYGDGGTGGSGGEGGKGGTAAAEIAGNVQGAPGAPVIGVAVLSDGGSGGSGASSTGGKASDGGLGGRGGAALSALVLVDDSGTIKTTGADAPNSAATAPAVLVRSNGGSGGTGGDATAGIGSQGGSAGAGGPGYMASAIVNGVVSTTGSFAHGILAQSVGGAGALGGDASALFGARGGVALNGGAGGKIFVNGSGGSIVTSGSGASAIVGQSVGGGGGTGGNATGGGLAIGGNGGAGGDGNAVAIGLTSDSQSAKLSDLLVTRGDSATAVVGQSVGGAGGNGGNAIAFDTGPISLAIGGDGKGGGNGGTVDVTNDGVVTTFGAHSGGLAAQSVGGGGGNGGAGVAISAGVVTTAFALGGAGGGGGSGNRVTVVNDSQVTTYGADSYGMKAQTVGGGGGEGGAALATAIALSPDPEVPAISVAVGIGGSGGAGGDQSKAPVTLNNHGLVTTAGAGSIGVFAQNIGGGGGNGGDSTASSYASAGKDGVSISVASSVGGSAGSGGIGGTVMVTNDGLIVTLGESAHGIEAQSIGGGGGTGGIGDSSASAGSGTNSYAGTVSVGGSGGTASQGGVVGVTNDAGITTRGDGARGILGQSVGGGGGASGGGTAKANGSTLSLGVTVGGNGGSGGTGGNVTVVNNQGLLTRGADADAIFAQSVGGGGGVAGKGASSAGGAQDPKAAVNTLATAIANSFGLGQGTTQLADGVYKVGDGALKFVNQVSQLAGLLGDGVQRLRGDDGGDGSATSIQLHATIGGRGGAGGDGGVVSVTNGGSIETDGARSDAIFAQSVGGGGGVGGASSFSGSVSSGDDDGASASLTVGARGDGGGKGNAVSVVNARGASLVTRGVATYGIDAQSIGGGGGKGGMTGATGGALKDLTVTVGGSGGAGNVGGAVTVDNDGAIAVTGRQSIGILAQSIGGGGGTAHVLSSDAGAPSTATGDGAHVTASLGGGGGAGGAGQGVTVVHGQGGAASIQSDGIGGIGIVAQSIGGGGGLLLATSGTVDGAGIDHGTVIPIRIGGPGGSSGAGGPVAVTVGATAPGASTPSIGTAGADAYGILAQSIGGGGGLFAGAVPGTPLAQLFGGAQSGDGSSVAVALTNQGWIYTSGAGSAGIVAQSIGGGGALLGGLSNVVLANGIRVNPTPQGGQGGNVTVTLDTGGNIVTTGAAAHGIVAQAFGGGGGVMASPDGNGYAFAGASPQSCSGSACTGTIAVTLGSNTVVRTTGNGAYGVVVQSSGNGNNDAVVTVGANAFVESWSQSAGGILMDAAGSNSVVNHGTIDDGTLTNGGKASDRGVAVAGRQGMTVSNDGTINGSILMPAGGRVDNLGGASLKASTVDLGGRGVLTNAGTIDVGGPMTATMRINGDFVQQPGGTVVLDVDPANGRSDVLRVDGRVRLDGRLLLRAVSLTPDPIAVVTSGATADATGLRVTDGGGGRLFGYGASSSGSGVNVTPYASLAASARDQSLGGGRVALADHLQSGFVHGMSSSQAGLYAQLAALPDARSYRRALDSLSGETLQASAVAAHASSLDFAERMSACPTLDADRPYAEHRCGWLRVIDNRTHRGSSDDAAGFSNETNTLQGGGQTDLGRGWFVGGSVGYDHSRTRAQETGGLVSGDSGTVGAVLKREVGPWLFAGGVDYGRGSFDTRRSIVVGSLQATATGRFRMSHAGVHGRIAYRLDEGGWYVKPYVDGHVVRMHTGAFDENGAGDFDLQVRRATGTIYSLSPMVELGTRRTLHSGLRVHAFGGLGGLFHDGAQWGATSTLRGSAVLGVAPFNATAELPRLQGKVNLGVDLGWLNATLRLEYAGAYGGGYTSQGASLKLDVLF